MRNSSPVPEATDQGSGTATPDGEGAADQERAAQAPIHEAVPVTANPVPAFPQDTPAAAVGRRTLSTAFVMVGPDGLLTVQLRDGRVLVLRNAVLRRNDYCGTQVLGPKPGAQYCGGYAEVAGARPGSMPAAE